MTDQQRWDALGCVSSWLKTPNIDRVARGGVRFANAYTQSPECVPARVGLALSSYPHNHGVRQNQHFTLPENTPTWMRVLRDSGYHTAVFGKTHLHPQSGDIRDRKHLVHSYGLDEVVEITGPRASRASSSDLTDVWREAGVFEAYRKDIKDRYASDKPFVVRPTTLPFDLYPDVWISEQSAEFLRSYDDDKPWMCWLSFPGPHEPWDTPEPWASKFRPQDMPAPTQFHVPGRWSREPSPRPRGDLDRKLKKRYQNLTPEDIAKLRADYAGRMALIDDRVGRVLGVVEERGETGRTVVVFISDHGEMNGDFGLLYKSVMLGPATRIPIVIKVPEGFRGATSGAVSTAPAELTDIGPTLLDIAGVKTEFGRGSSLVPILERPERPADRVALVEFQKESMIATPKWKMAVNKRGAPYLLFNLAKDPLERKNLAGQPRHRATEQQLLKHMKRRMKETAGADPLPALHLLHLSKTGGTAVNDVLRRDLRVGTTPFGRMIFHGADAEELASLPPDDHFMFIMRDPLTRFASGFYSRYRKGQPRWYNEWRANERVAFERFPTPQALADGLASDDDEERRAAQTAMSSIRHLSRASRWLGDLAALRARENRIAYVARQETLDTDWQHIRRLLKLPDDAELPNDPISAHRSGGNESREFNPRQEQALRDWYAEDFAILEYCDELRAAHGWGMPLPDAPPARSPDRRPASEQLLDGPVDEALLRTLLKSSGHSSTAAIWTMLMRHLKVKSGAVVGTRKGEFAVKALLGCPDLERLYVVDAGVDPNARANRVPAPTPDVAAEMWRQCAARLEPFGERVVLLRGETQQVIGSIPDGTLDFVFIGDTTDSSLRGVTINVVSAFGKLRDGGWLVGAGFAESIWLHGRRSEPTMTFPFVVHFAEAVGARIYALPGRGFMLHKGDAEGFDFIDLTGKYTNLTMHAQITTQPAGHRVPTTFEVAGIRLAKRMHVDPPPVPTAAGISTPGAGKKGAKPAGQNRSAAAKQSGQTGAGRAGAGKTGAGRAGAGKTAAGQGRPGPKSAPTKRSQPVGRQQQLVARLPRRLRPPARRVLSAINGARTKPRE